MIATATGITLKPFNPFVIHPLRFHARLLTKVVKDDALETEVQAIAEKIASKSPVGIARMKLLLNNSYDAPTEVARQMEKLVASEHMKSWDAAEGGKAAIFD